MKKHFFIDQYEINTETNLKTRMTHVQIKKGQNILYDQFLQKAPFAIDYATIIENLN